MRVTDSMLFALSNARIQNSETRFATAEQVAQSGKRVSKPSDDPFAASVSRLETNKAAHAANTKQVASNASASLQVADATLDSVNNLLVQAHDIATQMATGTMSSQDRADAAIQVNQIRKQVLTLANTQVGSSYIFGGTKDSAPPFDAITAAFSGSADVRNIQIAANSTIPSSVSGAAVFGVGTGTDAFKALADLSTALTTNDVSGIQAQITGLNDVNNQVTAQRSVLGSLMDQFSTVSSAAASIATQAQTTAGNLVNADTMTSFSELTAAQNSLQAAVQVASQLPLPTLASR